MDKANYSQIKPGNGQANVVCNINKRVLMSAKLQPDGLYEFTNLKVVSNDKNAPLSDDRTLANATRKIAGKLRFMFLARSSG